MITQGVTRRENRQSDGTVTVTLRLLARGFGQGAVAAPSR